MAGHQVIVLDPIKTFRFLDLPLEIREMVYKYTIGGLELDEGNGAQEHEVKPQCESNTPYAGR